MTAPREAFTARAAAVFRCEGKRRQKIISCTIITLMFRHAGLRRCLIRCLFLLFFPSSFARRGRERERERRGRSARSLAREVSSVETVASVPSSRPKLVGEESHALSRREDDTPSSFSPFHIFYTYVTFANPEKNINNCNNRFCGAFKDQRCCSPFPGEVFYFYFISAAESYG